MKLFAIRVVMRVLSWVTPRMAESIAPPLAAMVSRIQDYAAVPAVPVVLGLMVSEFLQIMWCMSSFLNFLPVLILQTGIMVLMITSWYFAWDLAKNPVNIKEDSKK